MSRDKIALILNKAVEVTRSVLATGEPVKWSGFGSLVVREVSPKRLYSPALKRYIITKSTRRIVFVEPRKRE